MKKKNFSAKLNLNKQSISRLNNSNLSGVKGGGTGGGGPIETKPNDSQTYCGCETWQTICNQYSCNCVESVNYPCEYTVQPGCKG